MKVIPFLAAATTLAAAAVANPHTILRYTFFAPAGTYGDAENPDVDGVAMVRYNANSGYTSISLVIRGLRPNTSYGVAVGDAFVDPSGLQTNHNGRMTYSSEFPFPPFPEQAVIQIFVYDGNEEEYWDISFDELRAFGIPN